MLAPKPPSGQRRERSESCHDSLLNGHWLRRPALHSPVGMKAFDPNDFFFA
jgi:hypothetical protein